MSPYMFVCIDVQEKLLRVVNDSNSVVENILKAHMGFRSLGLPIVFTRQYPKGLGDIDSRFELGGVEIFDKEVFSIFDDVNINNHIKNIGVKKLIFAGFETHICVHQSIVDALSLGYECIILEECCSSRNSKNHNLCISDLRHRGVWVAPIESILFDILGGCNHPNFKQISQLIK